MRSKGSPQGRSEMKAAETLGETHREASDVSRLIWISTAAVGFAALTAAWLAGLRFAHTAEFLRLCALSIGPMVALRLYARWRGLGGEGLALFLDIVPGFMIMAFLLLVAQYAAATRPILDLTAEAHRLDAALGFRWFDYVRTVSAVPGLDDLMSLCYRNWLGEFAAAMAALAFLRQYRRIGEFTVAYLLTAGATILCFAYVDVVAINSVAAFQLTGFHHPTAGGPHYLSTLRALRSGADRTLDFNHLQSLVTFPSLHSASALLLAAATRDLRVWRYPFLAFNVLVVVSTLSEGGHALTDVLGAVGIACGSLAAAGPLYRLWMRAQRERASASAAVPAAS
jgi:membrane-associated phospholipid phosphatase